MFKLPTKGPYSAKMLNGNMGSRWQEGLFLGYDRTSNTYVVYAENEIRHSRTLTRRPPSNRWDPDKLNQVSSTPWAIREIPEQKVKFAEGVQEDPKPREAYPMPRRFRINLQDLRNFGFTVGCPSCQYNEAHGRTKRGLDHTEACRRRIVEALKETEQGKRTAVAL